MSKHKTWLLALPILLANLAGSIPLEGTHAEEADMTSRDSWSRCECGTTRGPGMVNQTCGACATASLPIPCSYRGPPAAGLSDKVKEEIESLLDGLNVGHHERGA